MTNFLSIFLYLAKLIFHKELLMKLPSEGWCARWRPRAGRIWHLPDDLAFCQMIWHAFARRSGICQMRSGICQMKISAGECSMNQSVIIILSERARWVALVLSFTQHLRSCGANSDEHGAAGRRMRSKICCSLSTLSANTVPQKKNSLCFQILQHGLEIVGCDAAHQRRRRRQRKTRSSRHARRAHVKEHQQIFDKIALHRVTPSGKCQIAENESGICQIAENWIWHLPDDLALCQMIWQRCKTNLANARWLFATDRECKIWKFGNVKEEGNSKMIKSYIALGLSCLAIEGIISVSTSKMSWESSF